MRTALTSRANGALFVQPSGPNTEPLYLGCYDVDDLEEERGGVSPLYSFNADGVYTLEGVIQSPPDLVNLGLSTLSGLELEVLEQLCGAAALYLTVRTGGDADTFENWRRAIILDLRKVTSRTLRGWIRRSETAEMVSSFGVTAAFPIARAVRLQGYRQTTTETAAINGIAFCSPRCTDGAVMSPVATCHDGFFVCDVSIAGGSGINTHMRRRAALNMGMPVQMALPVIDGSIDAGDRGMLLWSYSTQFAPGSGFANVHVTDDGRTWAAAPTLPFGVGEDIIASCCFTAGVSSPRKMIASGTATGNPVRVAYTHDDGITWTTVSVGSVAGQHVPGRGGLFALNHAAVYLGTDDGYVYRSEDGGATWTAVLSGTLTSSAYYALHFRDRDTGMAVGAGGVVSVTSDSGVTWSAASSPSGDDLVSVHHNGVFWWVATAGGELYYSQDTGGTWTQRDGFAGSGSGVVTWVDWLDRFRGMATHTIAGAGYLLYTIDGGYTWDRVPIPTNAGLNMVKMCNATTAYIVGEPQGGTGFVAQVRAVA